MVVNEMAAIFFDHTNYLLHFLARDKRQELATWKF